MGIQTQAHPRSRSRLSLEVGSRVVHPRLGPGVVVARGTRRVMGSPGEYVEIDVPHAHVRVAVPADGARRLGLRPVMGRRMLTRVSEVLAARPEEILGPWNARRNGYRERLAAGDLLELAALVRDLHARRAVHLRAGAAGSIPRTSRLRARARDGRAPGDRRAARGRAAEPTRGGHVIDDRQDARGGTPQAPVGVGGEEAERELLRVRAALEHATSAYEEALAAGKRARSAADVNAAFDRADALQTRLLALTRRLRALQADGTAPRRQRAAGSR